MTRVLTNSRLTSSVAAAKAIMAGAARFGEGRPYYQLLNQAPVGPRKARK
jgi:hypothetical protein